MLNWPAVILLAYIKNLQCGLKEHWDCLPIQLWYSMCSFYTFGDMLLMSDHLKGASKQLLEHAEPLKSPLQTCFLSQGMWSNDRFVKHFKGCIMTHSYSIDMIQLQVSSISHWNLYIFKWLKCLCALFEVLKKHEWSNTNLSQSVSMLL